MHRVRARQAQFLDTAGGGPARDAGSASADAAAGSSRKAWGRPLRVTLVGEGGAEAGLCLWECVCEDDDDASFADAAFADADEDLHLERGRSARDARSEKSDREWLRRGADAPAPGAVLAMDGRAARELSLRGGSRVSVFPLERGGGPALGRDGVQAAEGGRRDARRRLTRVSTGGVRSNGSRRRGDGDDGECLRSGTTVFDVCKDDIRCPRPRCSAALFGLIDIVSIIVVSKSGRAGEWRRHAWRDPPRGWRFTKAPVLAMRRS